MANLRYFRPLIWDMFRAFIKEHGKTRKPCAHASTDTPHHTHTHTNTTNTHTNKKKQGDLYATSPEGITTVMHTKTNETEHLGLYPEQVRFCPQTPLSSTPR